MIKANFNAYNTYVTDSLYQWDINQVLKVTGLNLDTIPEVHFSNANMGRAIVKQATLENHVVTVTIPNSLLQAPLKIYAHIGIYEEDTFKCLEVVEIPIIPRMRPEDYTIEDTDEEIYSFKALENKIENTILSIKEENRQFVETVNNLMVNVAEVEDEIENFEVKENKAVITRGTMVASQWSENTYSFESTYPVARYNIEIALDSTATEEQFNAFNSAQIVGSATTNIVKAFGDVPTVDIPIIIKVVTK